MILRFTDDWKLRVVHLADVFGSVRTESWDLKMADMQHHIHTLTHIHTQTGPNQPFQFINHLASSICNFNKFYTVKNYDSQA